MGRWGCLLLGLLLAASAAAEPQGGNPVISIIIDDIGDRLGPGQAVVALPGPVACAFLPHTPHAASLARAAHAAGKEVMLHLPLQSTDNDPLGPGGITLDMDRAQFDRVLAADLAAIPHVSGVNNHMGSLLTRHPGHMTWLMQALAGRGLFFVDSRTTPLTVALQMAREVGVPALRRHVFLDHDPSPAAVAEQFDRLVALARRDGQAIAIGHPYGSTLAVLRARLPGLKADGVDLIPIRDMLERQKEPGLWQASLSPSPKAAKN